MKLSKSLWAAGFIIFAAVLPSFATGMSCPPAGGGAGRATFLLVALAVGYWVLVLANNQEKPLNLIGRIVGWVILAVALIGLICSAVAGYCLWRCPSGKCAWGPKKAMCAYTEKMPPCHGAMMEGTPGMPIEPKK